jgi:hypothetical protein
MTPGSNALQQVWQYLSVSFLRKKAKHVFMLNLRTSRQLF